MFKPCEKFGHCDSKSRINIENMDHSVSAHERSSELHWVARKSGYISCQACNHRCTEHSFPFFVTDVEDGFSVAGPREVLEGDRAGLKCSASVYNYTKGSIQWFKHDSIEGERPLTVETSENEDRGLYTFRSTSTRWSFSEELLFPNVSMMNKGYYTCRVKPLPSVDRFGNSARRGSKRRNPYDRVAAVVTYPEKSFKLKVLPLELPRFSSTTLAGEQTVIESSEDGLRLECRVEGRPRPRITWTLNDKAVSETTNTTRVQLSESDQVLSISYFTAKDEGLYVCKASNKVGEITTRQIVILKASADKDAVYANISIPVIIAVISALLLVVLLILVAKCCYRGRRQQWKDPPTPPTPRLTQYELPQNLEEDDECRMTLTSTTRDGSISPYAAGGHYAASVASNAPSIAPVHCHCHYGPPPSVCHSQMGTLQHPHRANNANNVYPKCSLCDFSVQTLPMHRMMTLKRYNHEPRSRSHSPPAPRLSAEF